jgi:succinate dehydrogenase hydrophobic anchor subunit
MQQVLIDYLHPRKFGSLGQAANMTLIVFTVLGALGLVKLAFGDGVTRAVKVLLHK